METRNEKAKPSAALRVMSMNDNVRQPCSWMLERISANSWNNNQLHECCDVEVDRRKDLMGDGNPNN